MNKKKGEIETHFDAYEDAKCDDHMMRIKTNFIEIVIASKR